MDVSSQSIKLANIYDGNCNKKKTDLIEMILYGCTANKLNKKRIRDISLTLLCMGAPVGIFLITFFSLKLRAWNFLTLIFYPLDKMWRNSLKNIDLLTNYDTFVINDRKCFAKKNFFSYKHTQCFLLAFFHSFSFITLF